MINNTIKGKDSPDIPTETELDKAQQAVSALIPDLNAHSPKSMTDAMFQLHTTVCKFRNEINYSTAEEIKVLLDAFIYACKVANIQAEEAKSFALLTKDLVEAKKQAITNAKFLQLEKDLQGSLNAFQDYANGSLSQAEKNAMPAFKLEFTNLLNDVLSQSDDLDKAEIEIKMRILHLLEKIQAIVCEKTVSTIGKPDLTAELLIRVMTKITLSLQPKVNRLVS